MTCSRKDLNTSCRRFPSVASNLRSCQNIQAERNVHLAELNQATHRKSMDTFAEQITRPAEDRVTMNIMKLISQHQEAIRILEQQLQKAQSRNCKCMQISSAFCPRATTPQASNKISKCSVGNRDCGQSYFGGKMEGSSSNNCMGYQNVRYLQECRTPNNYKCKRCNSNRVDL